MCLKLFENGNSEDSGENKRRMGPNGRNAVLQTSPVCCSNQGNGFCYTIVLELLDTIRRSIACSMTD